jgi:hypothetical protein
MRARALFVTLLWVSAGVGAARLFGGIAGPAGGCSAVFALSLLPAARFLRRRLRFEPPAESAFPTGPRRVLLLETGLAGLEPPTGKAAIRGSDVGR